MAQSYNLVSGDSHLQVPADFWTHRIPQQYQHLAPKRVKLPQGGEAIVSSDGKSYWPTTGSYAGFTPETFDPMVAIEYGTAVGSGGPEQRVREQERDGVDAELLFPGSSAVHGIKVSDHGGSLAMLSAYNDYLAEEFCGYAPDRLLGVGMLPSGGGVADKIAEMQRCKRIGLPAVGLGSLPSDKTYPVPEDDAFWAAALDLEMPLCIHTTINHGRGQLFQYVRQPEGEYPEDDFINRLYRHANPSRCGSLTICQLIFAGVFDRFPSLKIYFAENNIGWIPFYAEQMDIEYEKNHVWAERHFGIPKLDRLPSDYVKEHGYFGFFDDPIGVKLRYEIGVDHIIWGSDFPHVVTRWPESHASLDKQLAGVPDDERRKMVTTNVLGFLRMSPSSN
jgi:predicted TIM-barrel fold metal-dependent hydrolase